MDDTYPNTFIPSGFITLREAVRRCAVRLAPQVMERFEASAAAVNFMPRALREAILPAITTPRTIVSSAVSRGQVLSLVGLKPKDIISRHIEDPDEQDHWQRVAEEYRHAQGDKSIAWKRAIDLLHGWLMSGTVLAVCQVTETGAHDLILPERWRTQAAPGAFKYGHWPNYSGQLHSRGSGIVLLEAQPLDGILCPPMDPPPSPAAQGEVGPTPRSSELRFWMLGYADLLDPIIPSIWRLQRP